jgi:hypothetical protein
LSAESFPDRKKLPVVSRTKNLRTFCIIRNVNAVDTIDTPFSGVQWVNCLGLSDAISHRTHLSMASTWRSAEVCRVVASLQCRWLFDVSAVNPILLGTLGTNASRSPHNEIE